MNSQQMAPTSFQIIPEQSSCVNTQSHIQESAQENQTFQLLIRAYQRIKELEVENQKLINHLYTQQSNLIISELQKQIQRLNEQLSLKEAKICSLQKIGEKVMMDYVNIEKQHQKSRIQSSKANKARFTPVEQYKPALNSIANNQKYIFSTNSTPKNSKIKKVKTTFDEFLQSQLSYTKKEQKKNLKNSFSTSELNSLMKKVHLNHESALSVQKNKIAEYKNYCVRMQKKYTPRLNVHQPSKMLGSVYISKTQLRNSDSFNEKLFNQSSATTSKTGGFAYFQ